MEQEIIETVLKEILDEIKMIHLENVAKEKYAEDFIKKLLSIEAKVLSIETKSFDIKILQLELESNAKKIERLINEKPKNIIHKKQILLFPEYGAREYYNLVFGRLLFWMMIFVFGTYIFSLGKEFINNWAAVKQNEIQINQYKKAWDYLYYHENKNSKRKMDSTLFKKYK